MCTLIVLRQVVPGQSLVIASNRDESLTRPALPPRLVGPPKGDLEPGQVSEQPLSEQQGMGRSTTAQRSFVAPQDRHAGGTWIGLNDAGVFIGLTNRPAAASEDTGVSAHGTRSRGLLVRDLLRLEGVAAVRKALAGARGAGDPGEVGYRPFHLVACDEHDALRATLAEGADRPEIRELPPGVHVVCNRDGSDPGSRKVSWIERAVGSIDLAAPWREVRAGLIDVLRSHPFGHDSLESPCVHGEGYGTRSSTLLACSDDLCQAWHAEGAPCVTPYENYTHLLESLQSARV